MATWNTGPDPNQAYYAGQPGYPPPQQPGYPPMGGAYPPPGGGYPSAPQGFNQPPGGGYGFQPPPQQPPAYGSDPYNQGGYGGYNTGGETGEVKGFDFSDKSIRRGFIRKVYSILSMQLGLSVAFIAWFLYHKPTQRFVAQNSWLVIVAMVLSIVLLLTLACCGEIRRKAPTNFILLGLFTTVESFTLALISSTYKVEEVLMAVGVTAAVCLALTLFAFQTKWDFTMMGGVLFVAVIVLMIFGIVCIFVQNKIVQMVYASLGALIFSIYLIYDTQMLMGGNHKYSISPEEYIFAALQLYLDIINIFLYILTIIGHSRD